MTQTEDINNQPDNKRALVYLRVARVSEQDDGQFDMQRQRCEEMAKQYELTIIKEYREVGSGLTAAEDRPGLGRLLEELPIIKPRYLLVSDLARISRQVREVVAVDEYLMCVGAELLVYGEGPEQEGVRRRIAAVLADFDPKEERRHAR